MNIMNQTVNGKNYKVANGTFYHENTSDSVIRILENARINHERIRIFYGDVNTGRDWMEIYDTMGTVGRSCGSVKIPLLLNKRTSNGGGAILDHCIVKITIDKIIVYTNVNYYLPKLEIREASDYLKSKNYGYSVFADGDNIFNCNSMRKAENEVDFLKGIRNCH